MKRFILTTLLLTGALQLLAQLRPYYSNLEDKYGFVNEKGIVVVKPVYDLAWDFKEGISPVKLNGKYGFVNDQGEVMVSPKFEYAGFFSDGLCVVKVNGKYGFADQKGTLVVPAIYDRADNFHGDRANVSLRKHWSVMVYNNSRKKP